MLVVWSFVVLGIYLVIGLLWLMWLLGHALSQLLKPSQQRPSVSRPVAVPLPTPPSALLPPTSMNAEVPKDLADLRGRFQAELEATRSLPDERSRLLAELEVRKRFGAAIDGALAGGMAASSPEQRARWLPVIEAQRAGARLEWDKDGQVLGWWEGATFRAVDRSSP